MSSNLHGQSGASVAAVTGLASPLAQPSSSSSSSASASASARAAINLRTLQRLDKSIQRILWQVGYVMLYLHTGERWHKEPVEGSLFIYARAESPSYGLIILNRTEPKNFVLPITSNTTADVADRMVHLDTADPERDGDPVVGLYCHNGNEEAECLAQFITDLTTQPEPAHAPGPISENTADDSSSKPDATLSIENLMSRLSASRSQATAPNAETTMQSSSQVAGTFRKEEQTTSPTIALKQMLGLRRPEEELADVSSSSAGPSPQPSHNHPQSGTPSHKASRSVFDEPPAKPRTEKSRRAELVRTEFDVPVSEESSAAEDVDSSTNLRGRNAHGSMESPVSTPGKAKKSHRAEQTPRSKRSQEHPLSEAANSEVDSAPDTKFQGPSTSSLRTPKLKSAKAKGRKKATAANNFNPAGQSAAESMEEGSENPRKGHSKSKNKPLVMLKDAGYIPSPDRNGNLDRIVDDQRLKQVILQKMSATADPPPRPSRSKDVLVEEDDDSDQEPDQSTSPSKAAAAASEDVEDKEAKRQFVLALLNQIHTNQDFVNDLWRSYKQAAQ